MKLTPEEVDLFHAACADLGNEAAQELMNLFAVERPIDVLIQLPTVPLGLLAELVSHLLRAINTEYRKHTGCDLIFVDDAMA